MMKLATVAAAATVAGLALLVIAACGSDSTDSSSGSPGVFGGTSSGSSGSTAGVECTHPGAGNKLGGGDNRCECTSTQTISGEWSAKRSCRENVSCTIQDQDETFTFKQTGTDITGSGGGGFTFAGTICGDFITFHGPKNGGTECGQISIKDPTHWVFDSCIVTSGDCTPSFGQGCPDEKSQCTGTGAKKPESAAAIVKNICK